MRVYVSISVSEDSRNVIYRHTVHHELSGFYPVDLVGALDANKVLEVLTAEVVNEVEALEDKPEPEPEK